MGRPRPPGRRVAALLLALAGGLTGATAAAQTPGPVPESLQRVLELPGQRGLMRVIDAMRGVPGPFTTDGCSGGLSAGWALLSDVVPGFTDAYAHRPPWETCCIAHDRAYHVAGGAREAEQGYAARLAADMALRACVAATPATEGAGSPSGTAPPYADLADAMFGAVRLGGGPCSGLPWRWGYGFAPCIPELP
ncbi:hypothetical protein [Meridianimarinicoccus roseus]|uniref:hypothetical protein n=1 Tax=Meridianimarinicoccus roseus TaxID=2072018 RepID=UPI001EE68D5C|nr:hypothetical protein [Meridianimarinicoccus roseus]